MSRARYPELPQFYKLGDEQLQQLYNMIQVYSTQLGNELDTRDLIADEQPSIRVQVVTTVTTLGNPVVGDIAYAINSNSYKGYKSGGWAAL
tara:strand:- start:28859 stop:29131 length:273 start_codon:yes stop_codon:yes gene_type:complete